MKPLLLNAKEGKEYDIGTMVYRIKLRAEETGGLFSLMDFTLYPGAIGPGPHYHEHQSKTFFILAGKMTFFLDEEKHVLTPGQTVFVPKKTVHDFSNPCDNPCRFLLQLSPGGLENFYEEAADSNPAQFAELLKEYSIMMV